MSPPDDHPTSPASEPETAQEAAFLAAYRELDEADRVLVWSTILANLSQRVGPPEEEVIRDAGA